MANYARPYVQNFRDRSQETGRLSDLVRMRGAAEAQGYQQQGENSARMWAGLGLTAGKMLGDIADYRDKAPQRALEQVRIADEVKARADANRFKGLENSLTELGIQGDDRVREYEAAGFRPQALAEGERQRKVKADQIKQLGDGIETQNKQLGQVAKIFRGVAQASPADQPNRYFDAVREARKALPPEMHSLIPEQYSPENLQAVITKGEDVRDTYYYQQMSALAASEALRTEAGTRENVQKWNESLGLGLSVAKTAEDWNGWMTMAKNAGAPPEVLERYGEYSPQNVQRAAQFAVTLGKDKDGEFERTFLRPFAAEKAAKGGGPPTLDEIKRLRREFNDDPDVDPYATKADKPDDVLPTISNRNDAEKWRAAEKLKVAESRLKPEQKTAALADIERAYQAMLQPRGGGFAQSVTPQSPFGPPTPAKDGNALNMRNYLPTPAPAAPGAPGGRPAAPAPASARIPVKVPGGTMYFNSQAEADAYKAKLPKGK